MIYGHLFNKGKLRTAAGSFMLVNEDKVAYPVNKADAALWSECTGVTFEQLHDRISSKLGWKIPSHAISHVERFVNWCIWAKLVEVRGFTPDQFTELLQKDSLDEVTLKKLASIAPKETEA